MAKRPSNQPSSVRRGMNRFQNRSHTVDLQTAECFSPQQNAHIFMGTATNGPWGVWIC